jgi:hypothetical protein
MPKAGRTSPQMCPCLQTINQGRGTEFKNTCTSRRPRRKRQKQPYSARWNHKYGTAPRPKNDIKTDQMKKEMIMKTRQKTSTTQKHRAGRRAKEFRNLRHANPPTPSNPMHQNRRIPYTNAYQRTSTNAETRHNAGFQYGQHKC